MPKSVMPLETMLGPLLISVVHDATIIQSRICVDISIVYAVSWNHNDINRLCFSRIYVDMSGLCFKLLSCLCPSSCCH